MKLITKSGKVHLSKIRRMIFHDGIGDVQSPACRRIRNHEVANWLDFEGNERQLTCRKCRDILARIKRHA